MTDPKARYKELCSCLLSQRNAKGFWEGELSSSALSTSVAVVAFKLHDNPEDQERIASGIQWLTDNINEDGGFGDSPASISNVSTTLLSYAALSFIHVEKDCSQLLSRIEVYLSSQGIHLESENISQSILDFYGKDRTFSVPILSMLAISGVLPGRAVKHIPLLPFEFSLFPASWYKVFNLQVVSYAIPALIAVGIYIFCKRTENKTFPGYRKWFIKPALSKLLKIMPESGGFLEAIPLTGFTCMCLIASNKADHGVVTKGMDFLRKTQRSNGSWPIDTDLSTWVTSLSVKATGKDLVFMLPQPEIDVLRSHILSLQYKKKHAFNDAAPGGWGWTNFSGSVPDADDTPGALLALLTLYNEGNTENKAIIEGCQWLCKMSNKDGGFPTFCKGWGRLPFDRSCPDLTGHALLALCLSLDQTGYFMPAETKKRIKKTINKALQYLQKNQHCSGYWDPLWFGNQQMPAKNNPVYGTSKVCTYLTDTLVSRSLSNEQRQLIEKMISSARRFLQDNQNDDGSWGGIRDIPGTIEETSLAITALACFDPQACVKGLEWLDRQGLPEDLKSSPIGLYFAMLWYDEKLYPLIFYIEALRRYLKTEN